jgi:hypothetical protein
MEFNTEIRQIQINSKIEKVEVKSNIQKVEIKCTMLGYNNQGIPGKSAYEIAVMHGYAGTEEQWLLSLVGETGNGIQSIEKTSTVDKVDTYTVTYTDSTTTTFTVTNGTDGINGREVEIVNDGTNIKWRYAGTTEWTTIVSVASITGTDGREIELQVTTTHIQWRYAGGSWTNLIALSSITGANGRGIISIEKTSTLGLVDTYTITYSDATTSTFDVTNGEDAPTPGDMFKSTYDTNNDGSVDKADAIDGIEVAGNNKFYGTDETGVPGFYDLPSGTVQTVNEIAPIDGNITIDADDIDDGTNNKFLNTTNKASASDINAGTNDVKYITSKGIEDSNLIRSVGDTIKNVVALTKAEYDLLTTEDKANTLFNIIDEDTDGDNLITFLDNYILSKHPVGSIEINVTNTNPSTYLGGTWVAWGSGRVPVGVDAEQTEFDTVEETGGAKTHTLTEAQMPTHSHDVAVSGGAGSTQYCISAYSTSIPAYLCPSSSKGGGQAHNNLQPYITCYMWKRTA